MAKLTKEEIIMKRRSLEHLRTQMDNEMASFKSHWRDLADNILPRRIRLETSEVNRGEKKNGKIIDSTATMAVRTLSSGMMSGVTSPARPWFKLDLAGRELNKEEEFGAVRKWLDDSAKILRGIFLKSNLYNTLPTLYGDIGVFGTAALFIEEDFEDVIRTQTFPIGSYKIANDDKLRPRVFLREFRLTVRQVVDKFGRDKNTGKIDWEDISENVKNLYENGNLEAWVEVVHVIKPNEDFDPNKLEARFKRFVSIYYEQGFAGKNTPNSSQMSGNVEGKFLRLSGYNYFPVLCPRWETTGEDVYGTNCPAMTALGDIKQLQLGEKRTMQAVDKILNPPMIAPTSMKNAQVSLLPGDVNYVDMRDGLNGFRSAHDINFRINEMEEKQRQVRERINQAFFADLFLQLTMSDRRQITAREIEERHEEKLLALGPVLEQLNQDLLDPLIDIAFGIAAEQGRLPEPPEEIQGTELKIEYVSIMAQAQKLIGLGGIERFSGFVGNLGQVNPEVYDKVNSDSLVEVYGDITGVPAEIMNSEDEVAAIRAERQEAIQAQQQAEQAQAMAGAVKDLSETDTSQESLLNDLTGL